MILCCGEALIDMIPVETVEGQAAFAPVPGGAVFNTAIALGRLGAKAALWCGLSSDLFGQRLEEALMRSNVSAELCPRSDRPTTLAFVMLVGGQARYAFYDENTAARMVTPDELPALSEAVEATFFGGISLAVEPCGSAHEALCLHASKSRLTMIDPNIRPGFIRDEAAYRARLERMLAEADIVKLSDEDMAWLFRGEEEHAAIARLLGPLGVKVVLVTRGAAGASCHVADGRRIDRPAPPITVADTVGAGDTFNAGFLAGLERSGALSKDGIGDLDSTTFESCLQLAVNAASVTASRSGANPPWAEEVEWGRAAS